MLHGKGEDGGVRTMAPGPYYIACNRKVNGKSRFELLVSAVAFARDGD